MVEIYKIICKHVISLLVIINFESDTMSGHWAMNISKTKVRLSKFWPVTSFFSQHHSKIIAIFATENVSQVSTKGCKTTIPHLRGKFIIFLRSSGHFNGDTIFAVIVSFEWECSWIQQNSLWKGRDRVPDSKTQTNWNLFCQKNMNFLPVTFWYIGW